MRVLVDGRIVRDEWTDKDDNPRETFKNPSGAHRRSSLSPRAHRDDAQAHR